MSGFFVLCVRRLGKKRIRINISVFLRNILFFLNTLKVCFVHIVPSDIFKGHFRPSVVPQTLLFVTSIDGFNAAK